MLKKNVILFGGTGSLGKVVLDKLKKNNFNIVYSSTSKKKLINSKKKIRNNLNEIIALKCDLSEEKNIKHVIKTAFRKFKKIDYIINCSGIFYYDQLKKINNKTLIEIFKVNTFSTILINKYIEKFKKKNHIIKIITCGSSSTVIGSKDTISYCSSKHALLGAIKALNQTIYKKKIINYCLSFGTLDNKMGKKIKNIKNQKLISQNDIVESILYLLNLGKYGVPEELYLKRFY